MPTTLILKDIPNRLLDRLKASAARHDRSLSEEAIACLRSALVLAPKPLAEHSDRAEALRDELSGKNFQAGDIDTFRREGRR